MHKYKQSASEKNHKATKINYTRSSSCEKHCLLLSRLAAVNTTRQNVHHTSGVCTGAILPTSGDRLMQLCAPACSLLLLHITPTKHQLHSAILYRPCCCQETTQPDWFPALLPSCKPGCMPETSILAVAACRNPNLWATTVVKHMQSASRHSCQICLGSRHMFGRGKESKLGCQLNCTQPRANIAHNKHPSDACNNAVWYVVTVK